MGSPAMVEGRVGKGRVVFVATGCHVSKSEWPLQPAFVLMVRELVQYLGSGGLASAIASDRLAGQGAAMTIAAERAAGTPALFRLGTGSPEWRTSRCPGIGRTIGWSCPRRPSRGSIS